MLLAFVASAQKQFTLEDLNFGGRNYANMVPANRTNAWWGDRLMRMSRDTCYTVDVKTAKEKVLFSRDDITKWTVGVEVGSIPSFAKFSFPYADKPLVLIKGSKRRVLVDFKARKTVWSQQCQGETDNDTRWNALTRTSAFSKDYNLWITDAADKRIQVTTDGSREIVYAQSVHRNEFGISNGIFWNPDGTKVAFYRMDQSMVADYPQVTIPELDDTTSVIATPAPDKYPMAGQTSHKVTVGVYDMATARIVYLDAGDPTDRYFTNIAWSPDGKTVYMQEMNRGQNDMRLVSYDATTGKRIAQLYRETAEKYLEPMHPIVFLPWDSDKFIMQSEKDGYNHLYLFNSKGEQIRQITSGKWLVMDMLGFDAANKAVIIASNEASPIQQNLYRVDVETGRTTRIDEGGRGWHKGNLSASGRWIVDNYQENDVPRRIAIVNTETGASTRYFTAPDPWKGYTVPQYLCGTIKADDGVTDLYYRMVRPADFDPARKYPTVVYVYGGPHAHNVDAGWHYASRSWETYMAQKGYVLFILDNRGSANRGRDFDQATFHQLGQVEMRDQMKGVEFLRTLEYVDTARLGVHGWSFGGFMTISLMTNYPDVFKVGVAGGPVIDWKWYEVMYGERYMGTPQNNPEGYAKTSLLSKAKDLKGRLQIIIGLNDNTVVPQHAFSFLKACIASDTQPDFYVYPGEEHNMRKHQSVHLHERITRYFEDYLKPLH